MPPRNAHCIPRGLADTRDIQQAPALQLREIPCRRGFGSAGHLAVFPGRHATQKTTVACLKQTRQNFALARVDSLFIRPLPEGRFLHGSAHDLLRKHAASRKGLDKPQHPRGDVQAAPLSRVQSFVLGIARFLQLP